MGGGGLFGGGSGGAGGAMGGDSGRNPGNYWSAGNPPPLLPPVMQSGRAPSGMPNVRNGLPPASLDSFVLNAGGYADRIYGDEGAEHLPPFEEFLPENRINQGILGIRDAGLTTGHGSMLPPATGGDEFVKTEPFTMSGANFGGFQMGAAGMGSQSGNGGGNGNNGFGFNGGQFSGSFNGINGSFNPGSGTLNLGGNMNGFNFNTGPINFP